MNRGFFFALAALIAAMLNASEGHAVTNCEAKLKTLMGYQQRAVQLNQTILGTAKSANRHLNASFNEFKKYKATAAGRTACTAAGSGRVANQHRVYVRTVYEAVRHIVDFANTVGALHTEFRQFIAICIDSLKPTPAVQQLQANVRSQMACLERFVDEMNAHKVNATEYRRQYMQQDAVSGTTNDEDSIYFCADTYYDEWDSYDDLKWSLFWSYLVPRYELYRTGSGSDRYREADKLAYWMEKFTGQPFARTNCKGTDLTPLLMEAQQVLQDRGTVAPSRPAPRPQQGGWQAITQ